MSFYGGQFNNPTDTITFTAPCPCGRTATWRSERREVTSTHTLTCNCTEEP